MKKYIVMHFSDNFMMDGLATYYFKTKEEALEYIHDFKSWSKAHSKDTLRLVKIEEEYEMTVKDQTLNGELYGFKKKGK